MDKEYSDKLIEEAKKKNDYLAMFSRALNKPKPAGNSISNPRDYVQGYTDGIIFALYIAHVFGNIPKDDYEKKINDIISAYDKQFEFSETEFHKGEIIQDVSTNSKFLVCNSYGIIDRLDKSRKEILEVMFYAVKDFTQDDCIYSINYIDLENTVHKIDMDLDAIRNITIHYKYIEEAKETYKVIGKVTDEYIDKLSKAKKEYDEKMESLYNNAIK